MKLTQKQLAAKVGVTQQMISRILTGVANPSWELAKRLGAATGTNPVLWLEGTAEQKRKALSLVSGHESQRAVNY